MSARCWLVLAAAVASLGAAWADDAKLIATVDAQFKAMRSHTLENGLQVYLLPVPSSPVVTTMMAYKVGACDEDKSATGLSHYLEHLLFKGTDTLKPGDVDRITQRNGGRNNAYTSEDMTVYHFDFAADRYKEGLKIEADRMRNTRIDAKHEFEQEKGAVIAELKKGEDGPWDLEYKAILPLLYPKDDPYAHPVIGEEKHVRGATAEVITRYYDRWYHPNNAALVVVGGFDPDDALKTITDLFAKIPKGELPKRKQPVPAKPRTEPVRKEMSSKFDVARLMVGFNTVKVGDPDDYVLDVIDDVLSNGRTSRLYRRLVEGEELANGVATQNNVGRHPGWFAVNVEMIKGKDRKAAEKAVFEELTKLAEKPIPEEELKRVRRRMLAGYLFAKEDVHAVCDLIARGAMYDNPNYPKTYLTKLNQVTTADVQATAKKLLDAKSAVIVWSIPEDEKQVGRHPKGGEPTRSARMTGSRLNKDTPKPAAPGIDLTKATRVVLKSGVTALLLENRRLPIVVADVHIKDVRLREPAAKAGVAALLGDMLEEGTEKRTGEQVAEIIEATGGSLSLSASGGSVKVLTPDADTGLGLLFECLTRPSLPKEALERRRAQLLSTIADVETQPQNRARQVLNAAVYGDHPYARSQYGTKEVVKALTAADLKAFHAAAFNPHAAIVVVVGDFDTTDMTQKLEGLTADWKGEPLKEVKVVAPPKDGAPGEIITPDPTAAQTHVFVGHLGITRTDPDFHALLVMDNVLGVGPGFTDRLSSTLRDRQGLAYTVNASIAGNAGDQPGLFVGYIGTFADKYTWVREGFLKEIARIRDEKATDEEVESAKKYLLGSLPFLLATNDGIAAQLLSVERYGLGLDYLDKYKKAVEAVTADDVQRVAKKHLDPKKLTIATVGPVGTDGKPLKDEKDK
ncbi:MAG: insulinase family protein [Fimbriiglobus sp.]|nr:insulinase family protein [Fimbriiglobus sp.]